MRTETVNGKNYQVTEAGVFYNEKTYQHVINAMEKARYRGARVKFAWGDPNTGKSWDEENDIIGTIGLSTGKVKMSLLIATKRSFGGGAISDDCIVKMTDTKTGEILYQHPKYEAPVIDIIPSDMAEYKFNTIVNGKLYGRHKSLRSAKILKSKLI
ncbi:MAG: hypothetical protein WCI57_04940 [Candidatus Berkelbacteria bacterium]